MKFSLGLFLTGVFVGFLAHFLLGSFNESDSLKRATGTLSKTVSDTFGLKKEESLLEIDLSAQPKETAKDFEKAEKLAEKRGGRLGLSIQSSSELLGSSLLEKSGKVFYEQSSTFSGVAQNTESSSVRYAKVNYPRIFITEVQLASESSVNEEFVEIYNPTDEDIDLSGWYIQKKTKNAGSFSTFVSKNKIEGFVIGARSHFVFAHPSSSFKYDAPVSYGLAENNSLIIRNPNGEVSDKVGWGEAGECEGGCAGGPLPGESIRRKVYAGEYRDTDNNVLDFDIESCPSPGTQLGNCRTLSNSNGNAAVEQSPNSPPLVSPPNSAANVLISEIFYDAEASDGGKEFVELYNNGLADADLKGWSLLNGANSLAKFGSKSEDITIIKAGGYLLVGLNGYSGLPSADIARSGSLPNTSAQIILKDADGNQVDSVSYNNSVSEGQSLKRESWTSNNFIVEPNPTPHNSRGAY